MRSRELQFLNFIVLIGMAIVLAWVVTKVIGETVSTQYDHTTEVIGEIK